MDTIHAITVKRTNGRRRACSVQAVSAAACLFAAHATSAEGEWRHGEQWSQPGTGGWTNNPQKTALSNAGGYLNVRYPSQSGAPLYVADTIRRTLPATVTPTEIAFTLRAGETRPSEVKACFRASSSGNTWYRALPPPHAGETRSYTVPIDFSSGWVMGPNSAVEQFGTDVREVEWIGITISRHSRTAAQDYHIDDVTLGGLVWEGDEDKDGVPNAWEVAHDLDAGDWRDAWIDSDGDGMNNYAEYRAGTDPTNRLSVFEVQIDRSGLPPHARPVTISWRSISNRTYAILRSDSPLAGFAPVGTAGATPPENTYQPPTPPHDGPWFYRIRVEGQ